MTLPVIILDTTANTHRVLAAGELIPASAILSTDAANAAGVGSDGGLFVTQQTVFPDDQVLTAGTSTTNTVTLIPSVVGTETNYQIAVASKISTASGNLLTVDSEGLVVPALTTTTATATVNTGVTPTTFHGGNTSALGTPDGWVNATLQNGTVVKLAYYL